MLKKFALVLLLLGLGIYLGYQLPRGAGLIAALTSFGQSPEDDYTNTASHQAFLDFQAMLEQGREMVLRDARSEQEAIEGMRWLLRVVAMSTEVAADANPALPHFQRMDTDVRKVGGDNPNAEYHNVQINGQYDYVITGNIGSVSYLGFTVTGGLGTTPRRQVAYIADRDLSLDEHGNFTLILSKQKPELAGDWIEIPDDASGILVRQYIADRDKEVLAELDIEVLGGNPPRKMPSDADIATAIAGTSYAFLKLTTLHEYVLPELLEQPNRFIEVTSDNVGGEISGADNLYMIGSYQLADDEAMLLKVSPPETRYWNLTLETRWHETYDYLHRPTSLTLSEVQSGEDGKVEFVIAHQDPGHPNWLDSSGHNFGFMTFRWLDSRGLSVPLPDIQIVPYSSLQQ